MLYILGEFQALPINIRFPLQKFLTANFSVREAVLRRGEQSVFVRKVHTRSALPENISLLSGTSSALLPCNPEEPWGRKESGNP